jgi:TetR/AcrR family transcriptional regulator
MKKKFFERKKQVLDAALDELIINNYEKASLNTIIKAAGISKGTFYYHFENKEALYLYLLKTGMEAKWKYIHAQTMSHSEDFDQLDIFDKFLYQAKMGSGFASEYPRYFKLSQMFSKEKNNPIYTNAIAHLGGDSTSIIEAMIFEAISKKELSSDFNQTFIVKLLSHMLMEFDQVFCEDEDFEKEKALENLEHYVEFMKYGLKNKYK